MLSSLLAGTEKEGPGESRVRTAGALHLLEHLCAQAWDARSVWVLNPQGTAWGSLPKSGSFLPARAPLEFHFSGRFAGPSWGRVGEVPGYGHGWVPKGSAFSGCG